MFTWLPFSLTAFYICIKLCCKFSVLDCQLVAIGIMGIQHLAGSCSAREKILAVNTGTSQGHHRAVCGG